MIKAQQIERDGTKHGAVRTFTDAQWESMIETYGDKLRWAIISEIPDKKTFPDDDIWPDDEEAHRVEPVSGEWTFDNMTKKMIISEYNLPEEDIKLNRKTLINKVLNLKE